MFPATYDKAESSSTGVRIVYLVTWCILPCHHMSACTAVQDNFDQYVLAVVDSEDCVILIGLYDAQLRLVDVVVAPMFLGLVGLILKSLVSDSLRSGVDE